MKNVTFVAFLSLLLFSCSEDKNQISIEEWSNTMAQDQIVIDYLKSISFSIEIAKEISINDLKFYHKIKQKNSENICALQKEVFEGNIAVEKYVAVRCNFLSKNIAIDEKYPFVKNLSLSLIHISEPTRPY